MGIVADRDYVLGIFPETAQILDQILQDQVVSIWCEILGEMRWDNIHHVPKNNTTERHRTLVAHIRGVTGMAMGLAKVAEQVQGAKIDRDALLVACLLHDASKPIETEPHPDQPAQGPDNAARPSRNSHLGAQVQHAVYVAHKMFARNMPLEIINLVITHTHQSNVRGTTAEAALLFYADYADSDVGLSEAGARMFSERWHLG